MSIKAPLLYRLLLLVLPPRFRRDFGADLGAVLVERLRDAPGAAARAWIWLIAVVDVLTTAPAEWAHALRHRRTGKAPGSNAMDHLTPDVRLAFRSLARRPGFTAIAVTTLALGIGANTAIFSVVNTVLLQPLPHPGGDRLVTMTPNPWTPIDVLRDVNQSGDSFEQIAAYYPRRFALTGGARPDQLEGAEVTPNFFRVFQAGLALGREFAATDGRAGAPRTAIVSYGVWQRRYDGARDVIGREIQVDGELHEIVGVLDRRFQQLTPRSEDPGLWIPFEADPIQGDDWNDDANYLIPVARLQPGVPLRRAQSELGVAMSRFKERNPGFQPPWTFQWASLKSQLVANVGTALLALQLAVGVVLLIACVNVANLLLARYSSRRSEVAIRSALGASRGRLVRELMTESLVLSVLGGLAALVLMLLGLKLVLALAPHVPRIDEVSIDIPVFLFTTGVSIATGLLVGALPAMATTRLSPQKVLKEGGRTQSASRKQRHISQVLVVTEIAFALILLVGAGLLARSFISLTRQELGFRADNVLTMSLNLPENRYQSMPAVTAFYHGVLESLERMPEVEFAALSKNPPISRGSSTRPYLVEGDADVEDEWEDAHFDVISGDYFLALGIPLLRGRAFDKTDRRGTLPVAIVDEAFARDAWPGQDAIGQRFRYEEEERWLTVVGLVGNTRGNGLANDPGPGFYIPYQQLPETTTELAVSRSHTLFLVRSRLGVQRLARSLRRATWEVDPQQPVPEITTLERIISQGVAPERFRAVLLGSFAVIALILVITGIYGLISHTVSQQTHEFGIRIAMGATSRNVIQYILKWGLRLIALGVVFGLGGTFLLARYLESFLFGVTPSDPITLVAAVAAIVLAALLAAFVPAYRATRVDPIIALRSDQRAAEAAV